MSWMKLLLLLGCVWSLAIYHMRGVIGHCELVVLALLAIKLQVHVLADYSIVMVPTLPTSQLSLKILR